MNGNMIKKVGLRLEAKNIVADDGKEAVQITSYFNGAGDGNIWKKVTEWTDRQDGGISSGLAEKDFNTNFKRYQGRKGEGYNMIESKEKTLTLIQKNVNILYLCTLVLTHCQWNRYKIWVKI